MSIVEAQLQAHMVYSVVGGGGRALGTLGWRVGESSDWSGNVATTTRPQPPSSNSPVVCPASEKITKASGYW